MRAVPAAPRLPSLTLVALLFAVPAAAQNSTEKIRQAPGPVAERAGSAVPWRADLAAALAEARETQRPVLWYVPTIRRSFMDRKPEVDRAMLAGPFSWPRTIDLLAEHYVPVRMAAGQAECERYALEPIGFIEPGYLVLAPDGAELDRQDRLSTLHPLWFEARLAPLVGADVDVDSNAPWHTPDGELDAPTALFEAGALAWREKRPADGRAIWERLIAGHADHPLAWKAAMELEGHGPLARGLESWSELPSDALAASGKGTQCAEGVYDEAALWRRGLSYLLEVQREDGSFRDSIYDFGGTDGLPNVYVAVTGIAATAMVHGLERLDPDIEEDAALAARLRPALAQALRYCLDDESLNKRDSDELVWGHIYRIRAAATYRDALARGLTPVEGASAGALLQLAVELVALQRPDGSWAHEYPNPFVTANALIALHEAGVTGLPSAEDAVRAGTQALLRCRTAEGAYSYGMAREGRPARGAIQGSVGRTPLGEHALTLWSPDDSLGLEKAIAASFEHEEHLLPVRKYDDHTRNFAYGGFFFWYDMHARTEAIAELAVDAAREGFAARQRALVLSLPEIDGTFIDSHEVGKVYGTAMALWCLAELGR